MYIYEENQSFENIYSVYQPIFDLNSGRIYANESLVRGKDECFRNPLDLIQYHRQEGTVHIMDSQCHQKSVESIKPHKYHQNIFLNIECITMDSQCHLEDLNRLLDENGISRSDVVLEVCERCYDIDTFTLGQCFEKYIAAGYRLALDDIDVSMLGMNTELLSKCSFMKVSINLI